MAGSWFSLSAETWDPKCLGWWRKADSAAVPWGPHFAWEQGLDRKSVLSKTKSWCFRSRLILADWLSNRQYICVIIKQQSAYPISIDHVNQKFAFLFQYSLSFYPNHSLENRGLCQPLWKNTGLISIGLRAWERTGGSGPQAKRQEILPCLSSFNGSKESHWTGIN